MPYKNIADARKRDRRYWLKTRAEGPKPQQLPIGVVKDLGIKVPKDGLKIAVIPDVQAMPGVSFSHLTAYGKYIAAKQPDVIVCIGDFGDFPSLSHFDRGTLQFEGRRYKKDLGAFHQAMETLLEPINKVNGYNPHLEFTMGNHEDHIRRAVNEDPKLEGLMSTDDLRLADYGWRVHEFLQPVAVGGVAFCLTPDHKVLTKDLRYVPLSEIRVGDDLLAFDEDGPYREYRSSSVVKVKRAVSPVFAVTLSNGKTFKVTADHRWLTSQGATQQWTATADLTIGTPVPRFFNEWTADRSYDAGWLAGIFDGEGWLSKPNTKQGGIQLGVGQNEGPTLARIMSAFAHRGVKQTKHNKAGGTCRNLRIGGPSSDKLMLLGQLRPRRLLEKFQPEMLGRLYAIARDTIVSIEPLGEMEIAQVETTSGTLIVEGYGHHNCHFYPSGVMGRPITSARALLTKLHMSCFAGHQQGRDVAFGRRADGNDMTAIISGSFYAHSYEYLSPFTNAHWRGAWFLHQVQDGKFDEMSLSLDYLLRRFG